MASVLTIEVDAKPIADLAKDLSVFGAKLPNAQALVLNRVTTRARARVVPALTAQSGLNKRTIVRAVRTLRASPSNPRAGLLSRGGDVSYRYFEAREQGSGVIAKVGRERVFIRGGFRRSGVANRRVISKLNGQVFLNPSRRWRGRIQKQRSDMNIAEQMIVDASQTAFDAVVAQELPTEIARELAKILPGH